ncbi:synaptotagmin-like protein 2 isoform X3 [Erinaceus europaeus]|uniref:Synaptotagmin-like protein 2 isoform X3 n=1 Tax=Erinaceus europaeus TaxID=9365 RepID=A0ABM3W9V4_ERIEU|nr:synaptotagmin-like protein 2 isoform X3 [Erinaceus europaeus]
MIDLSFLTEEEQEAIMKVLQRDAALKQAEEERVRHLHEKIKDDQQLKNMSGQWFYEAKAKRHRDRIHGADIIRASMRKKRLQAEAEQSKGQANKAKENWVNSIDKDALLSPELASVEEQEEVTPASPRSSLLNPDSTATGLSQENTRNSAMSPNKQRKNPFNSCELPGHLLQQTNNEQSKNGRTVFSQTSRKGELSVSKGKLLTLDMSSQKLEQPKQTFPGSKNGLQIKTPIPKARKMFKKSNNFKQDGAQPSSRQRTDSLNAKGAPRGILKRNSSSSSTDSETLRCHQNFSPRSKTLSSGLTIHERISEKHSLEDNDDSSNSLEPLKHVRFSAVSEELPQSPESAHSPDVGELSVLESDRLKNGIRDIGDRPEFEGDPQTSTSKKPLYSHQPASSPKASKNEAFQPRTSSSLPLSGCHSPSVVTTRPQSTENSLTVNEHRANSPQVLRHESDLPQRPADELSHAEPEPAQVPDHSSRDHQQGKHLLLMALNAQTSPSLSPHATEIRKTAEESISKVLDWFNRSSYSHDNQSSLQNLQGLEPKAKDSESQLAIASVANDTNLRKKDLEILPSSQGKGPPVGSESPFQPETNILPSGNNQDKNRNISSKPTHSSQQGKGNPGTSIQPFKLYGPCRGNTNMDYSRSSNNTGGGSKLLAPTSNNSCSVLKGPDPENQTPCSIKDAATSGVEEANPCVYGKNSRNSEGNVDSSPIIIDFGLKDSNKAETKSQVSLEPENSGLPLRAPNNRAHWEEPDVPMQREIGDVPKNHVQRQKYQRVSERISFWEGGETTTKQDQKQPPSPYSQGPCNGSQRLPVDSLATGQNEYIQATAKQVVLDEDGHETLPFSFYSVNKTKQTMPPVLTPLRNSPPAEQSGKMSPFPNKINEELPMKTLPMTDSSDSERNIILPALQHPSNAGSKAHVSLEKNRYLAGESNPNFKIISLKERMDESNAEQCYSHSQFENLRKFWELGPQMNGMINVEKNSIITGQKHPGSFNSQTHKEFSSLKSSGENTHGIETALSQKHVPVREKTEKLNPQSTSQGVPEEPTFFVRSHRKATHQMPGNEPLEENVDKTMERFVIPLLKEEEDYSLPEIQESIVKTIVSSKDYKDTLNDTLQKLLSETSSLPQTQPSSGKVHENQVLGPGVSENRTGFVVTEQESKEPREVVNEHVSKTVAPPKVRTNSLTASLDKLLKEASGLQAFPLQIKTEPAEASHPVAPPSPPHRKDTLGEVVNSIQDMPPMEDAPQEEEEMLLSQREISGTIEKVTFPPKLVSDHVNAVLEKLLRETLLSNSSKVEVVPGEAKEFPEGIQIVDNSSYFLGTTSPQAMKNIIVPDKKNCHPFNIAPDKTHKVGSDLAAPKSPLEQTQSLPSPTVSQSGGALPQKVREIMREIITQPQSELLEFRAGLNRPLEETTDTPSSKCEWDRGALSPVKLMGRAEVTKLSTVQVHTEEIKETIENAKVPSISQSAFNLRFEKLLKEVSETPYPPLGFVEEEPPHKEPSQVEQTRCWETGTCSGNRPASEAYYERNLEINAYCQVSQYDDGLRGGKAVTDLSADFSCSERGLGASAAPQSCVAHETGTIEALGFPKDRESEVTGAPEGAFLSSSRKSFEVVSVSGDKQPSPLLMSQGDPTKVSKVELTLVSPYARQEQEETGLSDSSFSDGNLHSHNSSSEEEPSPDLRTLERNAARKIPSKSLEDISSDSSNRAKVDNPPGELVRSAEDVFTVPAPLDDHFSHPDKLKRMSKSVPAFLQDEVSGSVMSLYSGDFGNLEVKGSIQFAVDYVDSLKELHVFVAQCKDLAAADTKKQRSDAYIKSYLLPDKGKMGKKKTVVVKKTLNPVYNEILRYKVEKQTLQTQKLNLSVWHRDTFKRNSFLGEVELDFDSWDWDNKENKQLKWYPLKHKIPPVTLEAEKRGEMKLALQYVPEPTPGKTSPTTGEVHIWVKECLDLPPLRNNQLNSFVKCTILPDTSRKSRQKTRAVGKTTHPVFNHTMVYDGFRPEDLTEACVELTVWDHYKLTNQFLGGLRIGFGTGQSYGMKVEWMDSTPEEVAIWEKMVNAPNTWVEVTLPLRMLMVAKISK